MTQRRSKESVRATGSRSRSKKTQADAKKPRKPRKSPPANLFEKGNKIGVTFKPGNELWKRGLLKRRPCQTGEELLALAAEYFEWADKNPLYEQVAAQFQGVYVKDQVEKMRPYTIAGLCLFIGIGQRTFYDWKESEIFGEACETIHQIIYEQTFSGAAAGLLSPVLIGRVLGLKEQSELSSTNAHIVAEAKTPEQAREHLTMFNQILEKAVSNAA